MPRCAIAALAMLAVISWPCAAGNIPASTEANKNSGRQQLIATAPASLPDEDIAAETALLESINRSREQAGIAPLRVEESLRQAARLHANLVVDHQRLDHQFPGEPSLLQRIADVSTLPLDRAGENLANATCPDDAHETLMRSPPHRENILDPHFNVAGVAAVWSHGHLYVVQDFGHAMPSYSALQTNKLVGQSIDEERRRARLPALAQVMSPHLNEAVCALAKDDHPNARLLAASYTNRSIVTYTQSQPEALPSGALRLLDNPNLHQFAVGSCYARNGAYPTGIYWVAILLY